MGGRGGVRCAVLVAWCCLAGCSSAPSSAGEESDVTSCESLREYTAEADELTHWVALNNIALAHALCGHNEEARALLDRATKRAPLEPVPAQNALWLSAIDDVSYEPASERTTALAQRAAAATEVTAIRTAVHVNSTIVEKLGGERFIDINVNGHELRLDVATSTLSTVKEAEWASFGADDAPGKEVALSIMDVELGRALCNYPGMETSTILGSSTDLAVDFVKRWVVGFLHPPVLTDGGLSYGKKPNLWDIGYVNVEASASRWFARNEVKAFAHVGSLNLLTAAIARVMKNRVPGDIAECGVFRGGTLAVAAASLEAYGAGKLTWAFDTFSGLPAAEIASDGLLSEWPSGSYAAAMDEVTGTFDRLGLRHRLRTVQGRFSQVASEELPKSLAILRVDADTYDGTRDALRLLYSKLQPGGYCIIDDFHLSGARRAVADFRKEFGITAPILPAPLDYELSCPLTAARQQDLAQDLIFTSHRIRREVMQLPQNVYWRVPPNPTEL